MRSDFLYLAGCSHPVAFGFGAIVFFAGRLLGGWTVAQSLASGAFVAGLIFSAFIFLGLYEGRARRLATRRAQERLLQLEAESDQQFLAALTVDDDRKALMIRQAIADYFSVPAEKVHSTDLLEDNSYKALAHDLIWSVLTQVTTELRLSFPKLRDGDIDNLQTVGEFVVAAKDILDQCDPLEGD